MIFKKIPKSVALALLLIKALDLRDAIKLCQKILYLWREFSIKVDIKPIITHYKICFYYKDTFLSKNYIETISESIPLIEALEQMEIEKYNKEDWKNLNNNRYKRGKDAR